MRIVVSALLLLATVATAQKDDICAQLNPVYARCRDLDDKATSCTELENLFSSPDTASSAAAEQLYITRCLESSPGQRSYKGSQLEDACDILLNPVYARCRDLENNVTSCTELENLFLSPDRVSSAAAEHLFGERCPESSPGEKRDFWSDLLAALSPPPQDKCAQYQRESLSYEACKLMVEGLDQLDPSRQCLFLDYVRKSGKAYSHIAEKFYRERCSFSEETLPPFRPVPTVPAPVTKPPNNIFPATDGKCGQSTKLKNRELRMSRNVMGRIVGGEATSDCSVVPWQVLLKAGRGLCGGSIISDRHILTAAHCVDDFRYRINEISVTVGGHKRDRKGEEEEVISVDNVKIHEDYDSYNFVHDIAIVYLSKPLDFRGKSCVAKICLDPTFQPNGTMCVVSGWGTTSFRGETSNVLKMARMKTHLGPDCHSKFRIRKYNYLSHPVGQVCAGKEIGGIDSCQGDSGGPLVCWNEASQNYVQAGVVSYGDGCALSNLPGIYTNVAQYYAWVQTQMGL